jgi:hypothetical protein
MHKIVVEEELPDSMHELSSTMGDDILLLCLPTGMDVFHGVVNDIW